MNTAPASPRLTTRRRTLVGLGGGLLATLGAILTRPWARNAPPAVAAALQTPVVPGDAASVQPLEGMAQVGGPFTREWFLPHVGSVFVVAEGAGELALTEVTPARELTDGSREWTSFSALFRARRGTAVPDDMLELEHPALGRMALLLTHVGRTTDPVELEAVFSTRVA